MEGWPSGLRHRLAKATYGSNCTEGSNPSPSAILKRIFSIIALAVIFVGLTHQGLLNYGNNLLIFECEAGLYNAQDDEFYSDKTGAELCNFKEIEQAVTSGNMNADTYEMTIFGKMAHIVVVYIGPILLAIIMGYIVV